MTMRKLKRRLLRTMNVKRTGFMPAAKSSNGKPTFWSFRRHLQGVKFKVTAFSVGGRQFGPGTMTIRRAG
jgi:hypothetical protein